MSVPSASLEIVQSWGVASARNTSGFPVYPTDLAAGALALCEVSSTSRLSGRLSSRLSGTSRVSSCSRLSNTSSRDSRNLGVTEYLYDIPIGPSVVRWDLAAQKRVMQFQAHPDLVACARKSPDLTMIASSCYDGGVKVWSPKWECLASTVAQGESQFHVSNVGSETPVGMYIRMFLIHSIP
jgi:WD40 repeat protein